MNSLRVLGHSTGYTGDCRRWRRRIVRLQHDDDLGRCCLARPLMLVDAGSLHKPLIAMIGSFAFVVLLALARGRISRFAGGLLLAAYPLTIWFAFLKRS